VRQDATMHDRWIDNATWRDDPWITSKPSRLVDEFKKGIVYGLSADTLSHHYLSM
jgi:hypothetical protein